MKMTKNYGPIGYKRTGKFATKSTMKFAIKNSGPFAYKRVKVTVPAGVKKQRVA